MYPLTVTCVCRCVSAAESRVSIMFKFTEGGVRVCGDAVLRYFWCGFAIIFISTRGIAVCGYYNL